MIVRRTATKDVVSQATYSDCGQYRYSLSREWSSDRGVLFVMLNPSTATELQNDPTVERCERRARSLGFGAFEVVNIFAWRATDPRDMRAAADPIGPENDQVLVNSLRRAATVICAWGNHGAHLGRALAVETLLRSAGMPLFHLGLTRQNQPRHPLYVAYSQAPVPW